MGRWDFLTNHALVLIQVIDHPRSSLREIAAAVGITERATLSIVQALERDRIISRLKQGRRNRHGLNIETLLSHLRQGAYSLEELASALFRLSLRVLESVASGDRAT